MSDPRKPGEEEPGISLPSWVDDAIARTRDKRSADPQGPTDAGPAAELSVTPPAPDPSARPDATSPTDPDSQTPVVVADSPRDARRRAVMPWVALALVFLAAALVIGYILLTKPR